MRFVARERDRSAVVHRGRTSLRNVVRVCSVVEDALNGRNPNCRMYQRGPRAADRRQAAVCHKQPVKCPSSIADDLKIS